MVVLELPIREKLAELKFLTSSFIFCAICQVADVVSSMGATPGSGFEEQNPFARHADGSFWLLHGVINKFWMLLLFGLISAIVYFSVEGIDQRAARIAACAPLIYFGAICLEAAFQNGMLLAGLGQFSLAKLL